MSLLTLFITIITIITNAYSKVFGFCNPSTVFPWETKKQLTLLAFKAAITADNTNNSTNSNTTNSTNMNNLNATSTTSSVLSFGPNTLRKSFSPLSVAFMNELQQTSFPNTAAYIYTQEVLATSPDTIPLAMRTRTRTHSNAATDISENDIIKQRSKSSLSSTSASLAQNAQNGLKSLSNLVPISTSNFITQLVLENQEKQKQRRFTDEDEEEGSSSNNSSHHNKNQSGISNTGNNRKNDSISNNTINNKIKKTNDNNKNKSVSSHVQDSLSKIDAQKTKLIKGFTNFFNGI